MAISTPTLGTLAQIMGALRGLTPNTHPQFFKARQQSGQTITYIPWYKAKEALDQFAPGWDWAIKEVGSVSGNIPEIRDGQGNVKRWGKPGHARVFVIGVLSVPTSEGVVQRTATGYEDFDNDSYGDPFSNASAMALNRAAALFDLGIDLYDKDKRAAIGAGQQQQGGYQQQQQQYPQQGYQPPQQGYGAPPAQGGGGLVAKHGKFKDVPLDSLTIDIGWLQYMSDPAKATQVNDMDRAMYQAELARRHSGAGQQVMPNPPAQYGAPPAGTQGAPYAPPPSAPGAYQNPMPGASPSNGTRSNEEIKDIFTAAQACGVNWEALVARARTEFNNEPKLLTVGELGLLKLMITKNKQKPEFLAAATQHFAGNANPQTWGSNELALLSAMV